MHRIPHSFRAAAGALLLAATLAGAAAPARASIEPPVTIDGPSGTIAEFGGVAIASDGTGGLVYTKVVDGAPHVYASRYVYGHWGPPIRVDDQPYDAASPRIAAEPHGRLLVVWVTQVATVHGQIRRGLFSASIGPGSQSFSPSLVVDPNVGAGTGVAPSLAGTVPGHALVTYRVVTDDFTAATQTADNAADVQLRPGDVIADIRLARLTGDRWSRLGAINRDGAVSMRPPAPDNGPQVAIGADGPGVVAWQEPDNTGVARIWARRVFGTVPGPVLPASPQTWNGQPVTDDVDAPSLDVSPLALAKLTMRVDASAGSPFGGPRLLLNALPVGEAQKSGTFTGAVLADGAGAGPPPGGTTAADVAAADGGDSGLLRVAYVSSGAAWLVRGDDSGIGGRTYLGPASGGNAVTALGPDGGGVVAWPAPDGAGGSAVALRQDFASGGSQTAIVSGARNGAISGLTVGRASTGDAVIGFLQGDPGRAEIVGDRISAPPASFEVSTPSDWVPPRRANVSWETATSGVSGGVTYAVLLDGRRIAGGLTGHFLRPAPAQLGSAAHRVQVVATDASGQQVASAPSDLKVDARAPTVSVTHAKRRTVVVRVVDKQSGVRTSRTDCSFGDRTRLSREHRNFRHTYKKPGRYTITVRTRDAVANATTQRISVRVR